MSNINIVTAPEHRYFPSMSLKVFLAGGITGCSQWQDIVIDTLCKDDDIDINYDSLYLINPRRENFVMKEGESERQVEWEFDMLERCDVFTMFFDGGESLQPICMYELGRYIERMKSRFSDWEDRIVITCDSKYKRLNDVIIQTRLATEGKVDVVVIDTTIDPNRAAWKHAHRIKERIKYVYPESHE